MTQLYTSILSHPSPLSSLRAVAVVSLVLALCHPLGTGLRTVAALQPLPASRDYLNECKVNDDCKKSRKMACYFTMPSGELVYCEGRDNCFCVDESRNCESSQDCVRRRAICVKPVSNAADSYCVPCTSLAERSPHPIPVDNDHNCQSVTPAPSVMPEATEEEDDDLSSSGSESGNDETNDSGSGGESNGDSGSGNGTDNDVNEPEETPGDGDAVCIAEATLERAGIPAAQRVYARARRAAVLCDAAANCATATHIVCFHGAPMTMRAYCALHVEGGCARRITRVNSPRMRKGLRVAAARHGLELTAFAARFGTRAEEWALAVLVMAGL